LYATTLPKFEAMRFTSYFVLALLVISCRQNEKNQVFADSILSFTTANSAISAHYQFNYAELSKLAIEIETTDSAKAWLKRLDSLSSLSNQVLNCLDRLEGETSKGDPFTEFDSRLIDFTDYVFHTITVRREHVQPDTLVLKLKSFGLRNYISRENSNHRALAVESIRSAILETNSRIAEYALGKSRLGCILEFDVISIILAQNATHLRKGDELIIEGGIGEISRRYPATFSFGKGSSLRPGYDGMVKYKKIISEEVGVHEIPVVVNYVDNYGKPIEETISVKYEVH